MTNADFIQQLDALTGAADGLRHDLARSGDLAALDMAPALVKAVKLNADFEKLAKQARKKLAPLFGREEPGDGDKPRRPRK